MGRNKVAETAHEWFQALHNAQLIEDLWEPFEKWMLESPEHQLAFARIEDLWLVGRLNNMSPDEILREIASDRDASSSGMMRARIRLPRWGVVAIVAAVGCSVWGAHQLRSQHVTETSQWEVYKTAVGERRHVLLADGSTADLNTDTTLRASISSGHRETHLDQGEALFQVVRDGAHPFVVYGGATHVDAIGTRFSVANRADQLTAIVMNGSVEVCAPAQEPRLVDAQQVATVVDDRLQVASLTREEAERRMAWIHDELRFNGQPLEEVVEEFNRYNHAQLHIADVAIRRLSVEGTYNPTDPQAFALRIERTLGVRSRARIGVDGETTIDLLAPKK